MKFVLGIRLGWKFSEKLLNKRVLVRYGALKGRV
jgi:hypothetical protein